jgi:hypothetical protein
MKMTAAKKAHGTYSSQRFQCGVQDAREGCLFQTRPYRLTVDGHERRQLFNETFSALARAGSSVGTISALLIGDEGRCKLSVNTLSDFVVGTTCWGPLKSARLRFTGEGRFVGTPNEGTPTNGFARPTMYLDDDGNMYASAFINQPSKGESDAQSYTWTIVCTDIVGAPQCPGRAGAGPVAAWPLGAFEEWGLGLVATVRPGPSSLPPRRVPQFTFTADFIGMPSYSITVNRLTSDSQR